MPVDYIHVLKLAKAGKWHEAHDIVDSLSDPKSCLIHGYLHRIEGDLGNARYWYYRAGEEMHNNTAEEEWQRLYTLMLSP